MSQSSVDTGAGPEVADELYDPLFHTQQEGVYDIYAVLRRDHPVYFSERRQVWCLTRHSDVQAAARNWEAFSSVPGGDLDTPNLYGPGNFLDDDPPRHDILRSVVRPFFIPKAIAQLTDDINRRVDQIMADLREKESADLAQEFALRLPIWVICRLLGTPEEDDETVQDLVLEIETHEPGSDTASERTLAALVQLKEYLSDLANHKRRHPDGKVLSRMVSGAGDGAPRADEVVGMAGILFAAGSETTFALIGNALEILQDHRRAVEPLRREGTPERFEAVIEEVLRFEPPVQYLARTVQSPVSMHGIDIPAGERAILIWGAANRDPDRWERPDQFDPNREQQRHLAFGEGIHFCIGAPLARLEAQIALPKFFRTFAEYEIDAKHRRRHHIVRGWERLDARLVAAQ